MKFIHCLKCDDVVKLVVCVRRTCECGESYGQYESDKTHATYGGPCVPIGFGNTSFVRALLRQPTGRDITQTFDAFVISKACETMQRLDDEIDVRALVLDRFEE